MVVAKVTARVRRLDNHLLAANSTGRELQLVAGTAPVALRLPADIHGRPPVRQVVVYGPRRVRGTHIRPAAGLTAGFRKTAVVERVVVDVAGHGGTL